MERVIVLRITQALCHNANRRRTWQQLAAACVILFTFICQTGTAVCGIFAAYWQHAQRNTAATHATAPVD